MLYTFSNSHYDLAELKAILAQVSENDAVLLWQNGVLQAIKNAELFVTLPNVFVLENDAIARGLSSPLPGLSLAEFVKLSEGYFPQIAL